jgi:hypothetical protein
MMRIYIDTSIVGGYFDEEFKVFTRPLFKLLEIQQVNFVVSDLLDLELMNAPLRVRNLLHQFPSSSFERIELSNEALTLADDNV